VAEVSPLRRRMIEDMTIRNLSAATQKSYVHHVHKLSEFCGRSPHRLGVADVRAISSRWWSEGFLGGPEPNRLRAAFFLRRHSGGTDLPERIAYARKPRQLPVVLSAAEVVIFLEDVALTIAPDSEDSWSVTVGAWAAQPGDVARADLQAKSIAARLPDQFDLSPEVT
jgi:hypothetical protein